MAVWDHGLEPATDSRDASWALVQDRRPWRDTHSFYSARAAALRNAHAGRGAARWARYIAAPYRMLCKS